MAERVRAHAIITGIVQGVFFRMETQRAAELHNVNGWVRNKRDGSVEAVFEGEQENVDAVLDWCREGPPRSVVHDVVVDWQDYTGDYGGFDITYASPSS